MRIGDSYKIKSLANAGESEASIIDRFKNTYDPDEVRAFLPKAKAKAKPKAKRKVKVKPKAVVEDTPDNNPDEGELDFLNTEE